jgi:dTDP-4-amino-4,6-dideoxygalactose transaminase
VEGGAIVFKDANAFERASEIINFGMNPGTSRVNRVGVNAKMSEVHAAFGLALLDEIDAIIRRRTDLFAVYSEGLPTSLEQPVWSKMASRITTYMPVLFRANEDRSRCEAALSSAGISSRRYFYPILGSDDEVEQLDVAKSASERVLCLPMYAELSEKDIATIISTIANVLE